MVLFVRSAFQDVSLGEARAGERVSSMTSVILIKGGSPDLRDPGIRLYQGREPRNAGPRLPRLSELVSRFGLKCLLVSPIGMVGGAKQADS